MCSYCVLFRLVMKSPCVMLVYFLVFIIYHKEVSSSSVSDYKNPDFYWPFDYETWIREIIEGKTAIANSQSQFGIIGNAPGYCRFTLVKSSIKLGTFDTICLSDLAKCKQGISILLWVRIDNIAKKTDDLKEEFSLLWTLGAVDDEPGIRIWYTVEKDGAKLHATVNGKNTENAVLPVLSDEWYQVVLTYSQTDGLKFIVNLKSIPTTKTSGTAKEYTEVDLVLGQYPNKKGVGAALEKSAVRIDNVVVWKRLLKMDELKNIYLAEFGKIDLVQGCRNKQNQFVVKWNKPKHEYSQIEAYSIKWYNNTKDDASFNIFIPINSSKKGEEQRSGFEIKIDYFKPNTYDYEIRVDAMTKSGVKFGDQIQCNSRNIAGGNHLQVVSKTPPSLSLIWKSSKNGNLKNALFTVTCESMIDGSIAREVRQRNLNLTILNLIPSTKYQVNITKFELNTKKYYNYRGIHQTTSLASTFNTSIVAMILQNVTWRFVTLKFKLHPEFKSYDMKYILIQKEVNNPSSRTKRKVVNLIGYTEFEMSIIPLKENTSYSFDMQVSDKGSKNIQGPHMAAPLVVKTKVRFVPPFISVENATVNALSLKLTLPEEVVSDQISMVKVRTKTKSEFKENVIPIPNKIAYLTVDGLMQYTSYEIFAVTGVDKMGSYGATGTTITVMTLDEDECKRHESVCGSNTECNNTLGSYQCNCLLGFYKTNPSSCSDIDECIQNNLCGEHAVCLNTKGSYICECMPRFRMTRSGCKDINECVYNTTCDENAVCINLQGSHRCDCKVGYEMIENICEDSDECQSKNNTCGDNSLCKNIPGSYKCSCRKGYVMVDMVCTDLNECQTRNNTCGQNSICNNIPGSYQCSCINGYVMENNNCIDLNECDSSNTCGSNAFCINTRGSFQCHCKIGYVMVDNICKDSDECATHNICDINAYCKNTPGSHQCICKNGYVMENNICTDLNECAANNTCDINAHCKNTPGSYQCICKNGYVMENNICKDSDECATNNTCDMNAYCKNTPGSYHCICKNGYVMENNICKDSDECATNNTCDMNAYCKNTPGSYQCICKNGYVMENNICKDLDECATNNTCDMNAYCKNTPGSYQCICKNGYQYVIADNICKDVNECLANGTCDINAICINFPGDYKCQCKNGYHFINKTCIDLNECLQSDVCKSNEMCINKPGFFLCNCKNGSYMKDGVCTDPDFNTTCTSETIRGVEWDVTKIGMVAVSACPEGSTGNATRECLSNADGSPVWGELDLSECMSVAMANIMQMNLVDVPGDEVANTIQTFVTQETKMHGGDLRNVVNIMDQLVSNQNSKNETKTLEFTETMVNITSSLLDTTTLEAWSDLPQEKRSKDAAQLLETSDTVIEASAQLIPQNETTKTIVTENIVMRLKRLPTIDIHNDDESISVTEDDSVQLPSEAINTAGKSVTVAMVTYTGLSDLIGIPKSTMLGKKNNNNLTMNSKITSISIFPLKKKTFEKPVVFVQELSQKMNGTSNCVYWHKNKQSAGGYWSDEGCVVHKVNDSHVTCYCYHLTNFAILMSVTDAPDQISDGHRLALSLITMIGISISLVALVISFITFVSIRIIRSLRNTIHQQLVIALFIAEALFLFGIERTESRIGCQVIAASLHYFFLVSFFIMALEGIVLYLMLVRVYRSLGTSGYGSTKYVALCWVLPLIFVMINLFIDDHAYAANGDYCWLSLRHGFIWSFVGPVIFVVLMNCIILTMTLRIMAQKAKKRTTVSDEIWFWTKGCCLLLSILGITWIIGIFYVDMNSIFMAYLFNIINSLQGLSIFVFHCLCDPRVRKAYYNFFCCVRHRQHSLQSRTRTTSSGSKAFLKKSKSKAKYKMGKGKGEDVPLYLNGTNPEVSFSTGRNSSTPDNSFGVLVGTNKF